MIKIIDNKDRNVLKEGRNLGIGFAMLKKIDKDTYETVNPISPCKDYLNEVIFTENTSFPSMGYGLKYPEKNNIYGKYYAYMVVKVLPKFGKETYDDKIDGIPVSKLRDIFKKKYKTVMKFLNEFEEELGLRKTKIIKAENDYFLVIFDKKWCVSTYSISLYTLLFRIGRLYQNEGVRDFIKIFDNNQNPHQDSYYLRTLKNLIHDILKFKTLPKNNYERICETIKKSLKYTPDYYYSPHHLGIIGYYSDYCSKRNKEEFLKKETKFKLS